MIVRVTLEVSVRRRYLSTPQMSDAPRDKDDPRRKAYLPEQPICAACGKPYVVTDGGNNHSLRTSYPTFSKHSSNRLMAWSPFYQNHFTPSFCLHRFLSILTASFGDATYH